MKKPKLMDDFKEFISRGNVIDMAVGVIIGGAFGKIITSLVNDIIMPALSLITSRIDITSLVYTIDFFEGEEAAEIKYGVFLQNALDFFIVALCVFFLVKLVGLFKKKAVAAEEEPEKEEPAPSKEELLLTEIRDILKEEANDEKIKEDVENT